MRQALQKILVRISGVETAQVDSFPSLKELLTNVSTDLVLLDLEMPGAEGFSSLSYLRRHYPKLSVAIVSGHVQTSVMRTALDMGAVAYIPKTLPVQKIAFALQQVLAGYTWAPPDARTKAPGHAKSDPASRLDKLTPQQKRVLGLIAQGRLNKQIAHELGMKEATVKWHVTAILRQLGLRRRTEAALLAQRMLEIS